jgi:phage protein D
MADKGGIMVPTGPLIAVRPSILVSGSDQGVSTNVLSLTVEESISGPAHCEMTLNNWSSGKPPGTLYFDRAILDFGKAIDVRFADVSIFKGRIHAIEAIFSEGVPPRLLISAGDRMRDLGTNPTTRFFSDVYLPVVFSMIASEHGLNTDIDFNGPQLPVLAQLNESDLAFITRLSEQYNLSVRVFDQTLKVRPRKGAGVPINLTQGRNLRSYRARADLAEQYTSLTVSGWDVRAKENIRQETNDALIQTELNGGEGAASLLRTAFDENKEHLFFEQIDDNQALALSQAAFLQRARRFVTGSGQAEGNPKLRAGCIVKITGLGPMFTGRYAVSSVCHRFDLSTGYATDIETFRADIGFSS